MLLKLQATLKKKRERNKKKKKKNWEFEHRNIDTVGYEGIISIAEYHDATDREEEGRGGGGRDTCMATQQFRVKCYVSESVMPMWAEANLWALSPRVNTRTRVHRRVHGVYAARGEAREATEHGVAPARCVLLADQIPCRLMLLAPISPTLVPHPRISVFSRRKRTRFERVNSNLPLLLLGETGGGGGIAETVAPLLYLWLIRWHVSER